MFNFPTDSYDHVFYLTEMFKSLFVWLKLSPRGVLFGIPSGGVPSGSPNPDTISDQNMSLFAPIFRPGARFSKVPIINGPGKLSPFPLKIEVSIVLHLT